MKLSIIINIYNSHEVVKRQVAYFRSLNLPDDIEIIFVDDGSSPPLGGYDLKNLRIHYTNDKRAWTQGLARNAGVKISKGEYVLMTDVDHILSKEAIMESYNFTGNRMIFPRFIGVLLEDGTLTQDTDILKEYGAILGTNRGLYASYHGNTFCIKKSDFLLIGGYPEFACVYGHHAGHRKGEDSYFNRRWARWSLKNNIKCDVGSRIYIFPVGRFNIKGDLNPKGLFHELDYTPVPQPNKI